MTPLNALIYDLIYDIPAIKCTKEEDVESGWTLVEKRKEPRARSMGRAMQIAD